jgi:hypothetical protein
MKSIFDELQRIADAGHRIGAVAVTSDGVEVTLISHPYTDGTSIKVLARTRPDDPSSWREFEVEELVVGRSGHPLSGTNRSSSFEGTPHDS